MNTWIRKVGMGAVALTLAGVLGGCNNGDGDSLIRLFFGINGNGNCSGVTVIVDLDDAEAFIARDQDGEVQCVLNAVLENNGCDIDFSEQNGNLRADISGCTIPAISNLFSCLFEDVDISELQETSSATCQCTTQNCDGDPPVCISLDPDPTSCEDCDNGIDDDGNGETDCDDPNCENFPGCSPTTTTSTTSTTVPDTTTTTVTTSTTVTSTTSTTIPQFLCTLTFRLADDVTVGALQWDTDYSNAPGTFPGSGNIGEPGEACASLVPEALYAVNDVDLEENLDSGLVSFAGFTGPLNLAQCQFLATTVPDDSDFTITVTEAANPDLAPIIPLPDVVIQTIDCDAPPETTTTTQPPLTTTTTEIGPTTTTTDPGTGEGIYNIVYTIATSSTAEPVGALQWLTDYSNAPGIFQDVAGNVDCTSPISGLFAPNDNDAAEALTLGVISFTGFSVPTTVATCIFDATSTPVPGDFPITIQDATDVNGSPITATITIAVNPVP